MARPLAPPLDVATLAVESLPVELATRFVVPYIAGTWPSIGDAQSDSTNRSICSRVAA
jgi:hypothetical protein